MLVVCRVASTAASNLTTKLGFDPFTIIISLLPILSQLFSSCFGPGPTPASVRDHLNNVYSNGQYDHTTLRVATHHARVQGRRNGRGHMPEADAQMIAIETLDRLRLGTDSEVQEAIDL